MKLLIRLSLALSASVALALLSSCASAPKGPMVGKTSLKGTEEYPIPWCAVDGKAVPRSTAIRRAYKGQEVRFCSEKCQHTFEADPASYWFF